MQVPLELLFGVDVAIKKLRPGANFQLEGTRFTNWSCPNNTEPPEWSEVIAQLEMDQQAYELWQKNNLTL
jgi:NADPH-dependent glutamate synthase beta subunit-like oxidoreductase